MLDCVASPDCVVPLDVTVVVCSLDFFAQAHSSNAPQSATAPARRRELIIGYLMTGQVA